MKKILTAAVLVGLSGTALMAQTKIDLSKLPANIQAQVKGATSSGPADKSINDLKGLITSYQTEVNSLISENPYIKDNPIATVLESILASAYPIVTTQVDGVQGSFTSVDALYNQLLNFTYPTACTASSAPVIQGIVKYTNTRKWALYNTDQEKPKLLYYFLDNVGQIGTGKEYIPSIARNDLVNAQVGPDGNGNTVVVCMDLASPTPVPPAPTPLVPPK